MTTTNRYQVTQGRSIAVIPATTLQAALLRGRQIGFPSPDSVVLVDADPAAIRAMAVRLSRELNEQAAVRAAGLDR